MDGWFETQFFRIYNEENVDILGETYSQVVTDYVNNFAINYLTLITGGQGFKFGENTRIDSRNDYRNIQLQE